ncbi:unnamed protein product, partial [Cyprideis torosa]
MEDHQHLQECSTHVEAKSTATDGDTASRGYGIGEDFHDGEKDLLSSEVLLQPNANDMPPAQPDDGKGDLSVLCIRRVRPFVHFESIKQLVPFKGRGFPPQSPLGIPWDFRLGYFPAYCPFNDCRADSSLTMEDHQNLEEFRTRVETKSTEAGSGGYGIVVNQIHLVESGKSRKPTCFSGGSSSGKPRTRTDNVFLWRQCIVVERDIKICQFSVFVLCVPSSIAPFKGRGFPPQSPLGIPWNFLLEYFPAYCPFNDCRAESSLTMEDHFHLEEFRTRVEAKSTEAGCGGYGISEDFHDGEKDLLSSEVLLQPNANEMPLAKQDDVKEGHACGVCNERFKYPSFLRRHERTHSGEKPFSCSL